MTRLWERHVLPRIVDRVCGVGELHKRRAQACSRLEGDVLELGFGSGLNVQHYPPTVTRIRAVEPNETAWRLAQKRRDAAATPIIRSGLDGQSLEEDDGSVDHVLSTFTMCTIPDLPRALIEAHRVLRAGGQIHFLEHGRSPDPGVRRWQARMEPVQRRLAGGCHLTRHPAEALAEAGFEVVDLVEGYVPGPAMARPGGYLFQGRAVKAG